MAPTRVVIFAKAPLAGLAKTRLIPALGMAGSAALAARLLQHALLQAVEADLGPVELCAAPTARHPIWDRLAIPEGVARSEQGDGDLGRRLARAAQRIVGGGERLLLMGTDCPALTSVRLRLAAAALGEHDASLIPATDGGYALLGLRRFHADLFTAMPWSTAEVAQLTRQRIAALGWSLAELSPLHDIDEPQDLQWLPAGWLSRGSV